ncbi:MAG: amino acid adenylation domain-containing protein [Pseudomonadota bacterium]|nr:amino acid adenylation domain-containing protein [Pseudomonadota bacterium]
MVCDATEFPLTPIQSWFLDRVANEVAHDNQAILLELRQPVAPQAVRQALERLVQRHAMLRVQLVRNGEEWRQTWRPAPVAELFELIEPRESLSAEEFAAIAARAQSSLDPRTGSVARFVLIAEPDRLRLLCVVHHFAVDMMSWHILVDELSSLLESAACKDHCEAPLQDDTTYQRWALHLQALARSDRLHEAREFWRSQRAALPDTATPAAGVDKEQDSEIVSCSFTSHETQRLESIAAVCGAQVQDVVLTALILAMRSPGPALLLDYESHGRFDDSCTEDVSRTVGWFTALFPMLLRVEEGSELPQAIAEISRQRQMFQRHGLAYGVLRYARALGSEFEDWPIAPMSFNHLGRVDASVSRHSVFARIDRAPGTTRAGHKNRFYAIEAISFIQDQSLHLELHCGRSVHVLVKCQLGQAQEVVRELLATQTDVFAPPIEPAVQRPRTLPITPIQHGMLLHCLSGPHSGVYINQVHCRLEGSLDIPSLADAWLEVIRRHAALHAGFLWEGVTAPVQFLASEPQLELIEIDWTGRDPAEHEILRDTWLVEDRRRGFRLDAPPLMRLCLVRLSSAAHLMVWTFHHLLVDGWSVGIVLKEVLASYEGRRCGKQAALPAPQPFAHQVQWAIRKSAEDRAAFWREQLKGASVMPALPIDKGRRNATDDFAASPGEEVALLSDQETGALVAFCRQYRFTMNTLVLAAWGLSLSRYATTSDVLFGVTLSGRDPDLHGMDTAVGMFINTVPLSLRVTPGATVLDWLGDVQRKQFALQSAQHSPLGNVAQWADLPRREQPFDSVVLFENYPFDASLMNFRGSVSVLDPAVIQQSNYPLILVVLPVGVVQLRISYAPMRFAAKDIQRLAEHVRLALAALIAQPRACMREISFLTPTEQMVWQTLAAGEQPSSSEACVQDLFQERCRHAAHSVAVEDKHRSLTYAQLDRQANQLAHHLIAMGIGPESTVGICVRRSLEMYVGLLAILKAGAAYLPLDPRLPPGRIATLVESAGASVVLAHGETISSLAEIGTGQLRLDESNREWLYCAEHTPVHYTHADNLAYVMFTSGSSGTPKGVLGTHRATNNCLQWMWDTYPFSEVDVCCQKTALAFGDSIQEILGPLLAGIPCVIVHDDVLLDPQKLIDQLAEHDVTRIVLVPSLLGAILKSVPDARSRVPKLTHWLASGEALSPQIANLFTALMPGCLLINMYGASELSNDVTVFEVDGQVPSVPIGTPVANMGVRILDDELSPVPTKVVGNLYARGPGLARGYLGRPDLSAQAFVPDPFAHTPGARMYRTGDLAFVDDNGQLHFAGRRDQQIKLRGVRIELGEITAALEGHPAVEQAFSAAIEGTVGERAVRTAVTWTRAQRLMNDPRCLTLPTGMPVLQHHQSETLHSFREIFVDRVYARNGVDIAPGDIVFDVGANIGLFTLFAHYEFGAKVFAFEPADASFALLRRNIELHGCSASAVKLGIAETQDVRRFIHYPHSSLMSGFHTDPERDAEVFRAAASATLADASQSERELLSHLDDLAAGRLVAQETQVQVTTISQVLCDAGVDRIDLLKIDAERSEWQVLIGIRDEDWPRIRQIVAEVEDDDGQLAAVKRLLCERGYSVSAEESTERFAGARMFTVYAIRADTQNFLRSTARHIRPAFPVGRKISAADLREHLRECLPDYMMPSSIEVLDEFPRTASGKIDRVALISQLRQVRNSHTMQLIPPETDLQRVVATVWQEILGIEAVGRDDNFFDLGGHSLLMIGVCNEIACRTGRFVSIIDVYQYPTVKGLAGLLSGANAIEDSGAVERGRRRASSRPPRRRSHQEVRG